MRSEVKPAAIDTRRVVLEMLLLAGRAVAAGVVVSLAAAAVIVGIVTLAS